MPLPLSLMHIVYVAAALQWSGSCKELSLLVWLPCMISRKYGWIRVDRLGRADELGDGVEELQDLVLRLQ